MDLLRQALESGTLNCTKGTFVNLSRAFAERLGVAPARSLRERPPFIVRSLL